LLIENGCEDFNQQSTIKKSAIDFPACEEAIDRKRDRPYLQPP